MRKFLYAIPLFAILLSGVATVTARQSREAVISRNLTGFNAMVKELELNYVDTMNIDKAFRDAIDGMLSELDPYTQYFNAEEQEQIVRMTTGDYGGIGSIIMQRNGSTYISEPLKDSPAALAGLRAGDHIIRVDTLDVSKKGSMEVTKVLRGTPGTMVEVQVVRPYTETGDSILTFSIERRKLHESSVPYYTILPGGVGYIRLKSFIDKTPDEVKSALMEFKENPEFKSLILDLRGNGGGLLESAVDLVGYFVPKGTEVLRTKGRDPRMEKIYKTRRNPILADTPMAVLIDGGSASAAEITAGALQDLDRAVLVGSRSYGKGLVQSTRPMPFEGLLKVTTAKYYIPSGRLIQALDYSRRNPDGSVARTPDSLTNVFHTRAGRLVRDGGGLNPDSIVEIPQPSRLVYNIVSDFWAFDFANKYAARHSAIPPVEQFEVSDSLYEEFKASIDPKRFQYDKPGEELLNQLRQVLKAEGYMNEETGAAIDSLGVLLTHDLQGDLDLKRKDVARYLADEIVTRYYYEPGRIAQQLKDDNELNAAIAILNNPQKYKKILSNAGVK